MKRITHFTPPPRLLARLTILAAALAAMTLATPMAVAQLLDTEYKTVTLREGHDAYVKLTQPLGFNPIAYREAQGSNVINDLAQRNICGQGQVVVDTNTRTSTFTRGTDPCFILYPSTGLEQGKKPPFISVVAAGDNCKNKPDTLPRLRIAAVGELFFKIKDDDDFAHWYCDGTMTEYNPAFRRDGCPAHQRPGTDNVCRAVCAPGQIYRDRLQATGGPGCETPPG